MKAKANGLTDGTEQRPLSSFKKDKLFSRPSDVIKHLISQLPADEKLTRGQTLFMARFLQFRGTRAVYQKVSSNLESCGSISKIDHAAVMHMRG